MSHDKPYWMVPCPFCGSEIKHIESLAKSFDPPRVYHEWHRVDEEDDCWVLRYRGKIVASATESEDSQRDAAKRWNMRSLRSMLR